MRSASSRNLMVMSGQNEKERQKQYDLHIKKILEIERAQNQKKIMDSQSRIADNLRRSKEVNRKFRKQQQKSHRHQQDKKMIKTLIEINRKPRIKTELSKKQFRLQTLPIRSISKQKIFTQQRISNQNVRLAKSIMQSACQAKQYKKKMKTQIDDYIRLRTQLQRFRPVEVRPESRRKSSKTANELLNLIRQKTEEVRRGQSKINISVPDESKESEIAQKERQLML